MNAPLSTGGHWQAAIAAGWDAVPGRDILDPVAGHFTVQGFNAICEAEMLSFAALARLFKHGQSLSLMLPSAGADHLLHLCYYLHRLRMDAMADLIRAPWLNRFEMAERPHLMVLTRPMIRHQQLSREAQLHTAILRSTTDAGPLAVERLATLLRDPSKDPAQAMAEIGAHTRPFAFLVDATPGGLPETAHRILTALADAFPTVPRVTLASLGDPMVLPLLNACPGAGHLWQMRRGDLTRLHKAERNAPPVAPVMPVAGKRAVLGARPAAKAASASKTSTQRNAEPATNPAVLPLRFDVGCVDDPTTDALLGRAASALRELYVAAKDEPPELRPQQTSALFKVFHGLSSNVVALSLREDHLTRATRPGRYPIRGLARWLETAQAPTFSYGKTQTAHAQAFAALTAAHAHLLQATTGMEQAVLAWIKQHAGPDQRTGILVETAFDVQLLHAHLDRFLDIDLHAHLIVQAMDNARDNAFGVRHFDHVLLLGKLWPNRLHWIGVDTSQLTVLCYPFQTRSLERQCQLWWSQHGARSSPDGDKARLWRLDVSQGLLRDAEVIAGDTPINVVSLDFKGVHPRSAKVVEFAATDQFEDWMATLMAPLPEDEALEDGASSEEVETGHAADRVFVYLRGEKEPVAWPKDRMALVLQNDELVSRLPVDLKPGDKVILFVNHEERLATQERLFALFVEQSTGLEQFVRIADKWQTFIDMAARKLATARALRAKFKAGGVDVTEQTIRNWTTHQVIGPDDPKAILILAQYLELNAPEKLKTHIHRAMQQVRNQRRSIGRDITQAILARQCGADKVKIGQLQLEVTALDSMMEVGEVVMVALPPLAEGPAPLTLCEVADQVDALYPNRLVYTPAGRRSLQDCDFADVEYFRGCLVVMSTKLHQMYVNKVGRMHDVVKDFTDKKIEFTSRMAETTQGRFAVYDRTYQGKKVDIGKHLKLGSNFDPRRTMRIHFHESVEEGLIVIHHAGRHLPTNAD